MNLSKILNSIHVIKVVGKPETKEIEKIIINSKNIEANSVFVAIKGLKTDGHKFIADAILNNASAVILENDTAVPESLFTKWDCVKILVKNSRKALAELSAVFYGEPSKKINLFGITGTKGKTTTSYFLKKIIKVSGRKPGLIGTNKNMIDEREIATKLTTPEANTINMLLSEMVAEDCSDAIMEISSHSIELHRIDYLDFDFGIFTNITSDHMDFHQSFENYFKAKKKFFDNLKPSANVIYNLDDKHALKMVNDSLAIRYSYGENPESNFRIVDVEYDLNGTSWKIFFEGNQYSLSTDLIGKFNAFNATAAFSAAVLAGIAIEKVINGIAATPQVPGRFEVISKAEKKVIIDYSHTADSLKQALISVRHLVGNRNPVHTVFGCGGDRDKTKRPVMGAIAEEYSDKIYVTSDNPRTENPSEIIDDIKKGLKKENHIILENREDAIRTAIMQSEANAVILIAGKGHENYQEINGVRRHFSDKETAQKYLNEI